MKKLTLIVSFLVLACVSYAQTLTSYFCDFEDPAENSQWVLNASAASRPLSEFNNKWYIGTAGGFGVGAAASSSGLYISSGTGADTLNSSYSSSKSVFVTASRTLQLAAGTYSVVFDWEAMGAIATDGVYVFWVEGSNTLTYGNYSDRTSMSLPAYATNSTRYGGSLTWRSSAFTFTTSGNGGKLVVLWLNSLTPSVEPAGKVDNIYIYQGTQCAAPTNVRYNGNAKSITWSGSASSYDVMLYNYNSKSLSVYNDITTTSFQMPNISEEGYYYIYVRSVCGDGYSTWAYTEKFVWIKGARCIDLFDLTSDNSGAAKCFAGSTENIKQTTGAIDYGSANELSQHTVHYIQGETDPRTGNQLKTIPDGEIASIRLGGHWNTDGNMSSTIEYEYDVQAGVSDILELKYAAILEYADYHSETDEARFKLEILRNGQPVDACSQGDFKAGFGETGSWHRYMYLKSEHPECNYDRDIYWCDWQTIAVSLRNYVGQRLLIRLTAYSCTATIHIGYAYFTLNCKGGDLQGIACGDFSTDHFEAPEGFNYRWYRADDPTHAVISTQRVFNIDRDDPTIYLVDLVSRTKSQCYYTLEANPNPRFPQAIASATKTTSAACKNTVDFSQNCRVVRINRQTLDSTFIDDPVESIMWDFGDGSAPVYSMSKDVSHAYPAEGGEYDVLVTAGMSGDVCLDSTYIHLSLPDISAKDTRDTTHICGEGTDHVDEESLRNPYGCDYTAFHHVLYHRIYDTLYTERMCEGGRYLFPGDGKYYTSSIDTTLALKSPYGCDSTIRLQLIVDPRLIVDYSKDVNVCLDRAEIDIPYSVTSGMMDSIKVYFSDAARLWGLDSCYGFANGEEIRIPIPNSDMRPDNYDMQIEFGGERCHMDIQHATLHVQYKSSIVMQTNGFIALYNSNYNGGYNFVAYEWYKDGVLIESNDAYVPASQYDINSVYTVRLRRNGESAYIESCPIIYNPATALDDIDAANTSVFPTCVERGGILTVTGNEGFSIFSVLGTLIARYDKASYSGTINAPAERGIYIVAFDNKKAVQIVVR